MVVNPISWSTPKYLRPSALIRGFQCGFQSDCHRTRAISHSAVPPAENPSLNLDLELAAAQAALEKARAGLSAHRTSAGHWTGELSSSALSTATAVTALALARAASAPATAQSAAAELTAKIDTGLRWLARHQNADGGWGDTVKSLSNISTTTLCWAAFGAVPGGDAQHAETVERSARWLKQSAGGTAPDILAPAIIARYGKDRTFSVPILTHCALAGRLGSGREAWKHVIPLPFELAALPHQLFAAVRLPVVSYALPALIAIGQVRFHHAPPANPISRLLRASARHRTLHVLIGLQPENGGFLEATPLTSFVTMSLVGAGQAEHIVARRGIQFLIQAQRSDGSWPIDTNLATWVTTLAINALGGDFLKAASGSESAAKDGHPAPIATLRSWLLTQQYRVEHPYTHAAPGGWAWTDLPGGVPDADDTAGALLALRELSPTDDASREAALRGLTWLLDLQNRDGGIPTFCRGWGALPFDRSSADITAHALRAWQAWSAEVPVALQRRLDQGRERAIEFLVRTQRSDGSWLPLWFGNQHAPDDINPLYGTTRVLCALAATSARSAREAALRWLIDAQNVDGGWGGAHGVESSVEETALAVEALAMNRAFASEPVGEAASSAWKRGLRWLVQSVNDGAWKEPAPIGFYFAKLWYFERMYPLAFTAAALRRSAYSLSEDSKTTPGRR